MLKSLNIRGFPDSVDFCYDGEEALKKLQKSFYKEGNYFHSDYCLILSDLNMPIMDGYDFAQQARQLMDDEFKIPRELQPKLVAITGNVESAYIQRCFECKFD